MSLRQGNPKRTNSVTDPEILVISKVLIGLTCRSDRDSKNHRNIYNILLLPDKVINVYFPQFRLVILLSFLQKHELFFPLHLFPPYLLSKCLFCTYYCQALFRRQEKDDKNVEYLFFGAYVKYILFKATSNNTFVALEFLHKGNLGA